MKRLVLALVAVLGLAPAPAAAAPAEPGPTRRVVTSGLDPWELLVGPDGDLWVTDRISGRVLRVRPSDGATTTAVTVPDVFATPTGQDGLLGLALHPDLLVSSVNQYAYVASVYDADPGAAVERRSRITRYTYQRSSQKLVSPHVLVSGIPASNDHTSGRLVVGPDRRLYFSVGDQGANQFANACRPNQAQRLPTASEVAAGDWTAYQGKILRIALDGSVPADNPLLAGVRSHVWTYGHRNPQGLDFASDGTLWSSEHGPKADDEINRITAGGNYGWPRVSGYRDDQAYLYGNWSAAPACASLPYDDATIPPSVPTSLESDFVTDVVDPARTVYTVANGFNFRNLASPCGPSQNWFICYPTIAPSSLEVYESSGVAGWGRSLLVPSLKTGTVLRFPLGADGSVGAPQSLWTSTNRYRDVAVAADGRTFYVATDRTGTTAGLGGVPTSNLVNRGAIIELRYPAPAPATPGKRPPPPPSRR